MAEKQKIYNYRERFEHICNQYAYVFGKKHGLPEFTNDWVANRVGDVAYYGNVMVNFDEIKTDIDGKIPAFIWDGYRKTCDRDAEDCCYYSYLIGFRPTAHYPWWHRLIVRLTKNYLTYYCLRLRRIGDTLDIYAESQR